MNFLPIKDFITTAILPIAIDKIDHSFCILLEFWPLIDKMPQFEPGIQNDLSTCLNPLVFTATTN